MKQPLERAIDSVSINLAINSEVERIGEVGCGTPASFALEKFD
jgi:hypothetical protein